MSRPSSAAMPGPTCWDCGAANDPGASECWLCHCRDWRRAPRPLSPMKPGPGPTSEWGDLPGPDRTWMSPRTSEPEPLSEGGPFPVGLALGIVSLGAMVVAPGLAIAVLILVLPAWLGAESIANRRWDRGLTTSTARKLAWTAALMVVLPILLVLALLIALLLICQFVGPMTFH